MHVEDDLQQLANAGLICRYTGCDGRRYLHIVTWSEHQKIDKPSLSRLPACPHHHAGHRCGPCKGVCTRPAETPSTPAREIDAPSPKPPRGFDDASPNPLRSLDQPVCPAPTAPAASEGPANGQRAIPDDPTGASDADRQKTAGQKALAEPSPKAPRILSEGSAPGSRILDPGSFIPTGRDAPDAAGVSAKELVGEYVAACGQRSPGDVIGHLGRIAKKLLGEGIAAEHVRAGLRRYAEIQGHPTRLPSLVNDAMNAPAAGLVRPRFGSNVPAHTAWTNPVDAATAYAEEL